MRRDLRPTRRPAERQVSRGFEADLLTVAAPRRPEIALWVPFLSGPPDLGDLVRNSKA
jgi:hypothetical protein